ncbi:hypothetical protein SUGI_0032220 [Cryptomeria japonica]|nr:hypothetical protein SUGI_0032220 [Cryptomeria japonica]
MAKLFSALLLMLFSLLGLSRSMGAGVFREYIGALYNGVQFSDMPINSGTQVDFILAFAIDYTTSSDPTDGKFNIFWDSENLTPSAVQAIKSQNQNEYHLDGIDIDYEHFDYSDADTFASCIGQLITQLKQNNVISFASIAPFDNEEVQTHYTALWNQYSSVIDYVNFQFYAYDSSTTVSQFIDHFNAQESRYSGGKVLTSFTTRGSGGLSPANGFFDACQTLKDSGKLQGIFVWCADSSKANGSFQYEAQAQALLQGS